MTQRRIGDFSLLPPAPDVCQECGRGHHPDAPHDAQSLYYQYAFFSEHQRWPDWADAMAHCDQETRHRWIAELAKFGVEVE